MRRNTVIHTPSNPPKPLINPKTGKLQCDLTGSHPRRTGPTFRRQAVSFRPSSAENYTAPVLKIIMYTKRIPPSHLPIHSFIFIRLPTAWLPGVAH